MAAQSTILVIGAFGQVGTELSRSLQDDYGQEQVIAADISKPPASFAGHSAYLDCTDAKKIFALVTEQRISIIYHLAAILSANAEAQPELAWDINIGGLRNVLEVARETGCQLFVPSSIAAFGPSTPRDKSPQLTIQRPTRLYGITKVTGELLADYYVARYGLDVRGLRYPGLISTTASPGGGTTDYAVELLREAAQQGRYTAPLQADTRLPMMYMPDAIKATRDLMAADKNRLRYANAYNITAFSLSPASLAAAVRQRLPDFQLDCVPDPRLQAIADSWPNSLDDQAAKEDWGWQPDYDLATMTREALTIFSQQTSNDTDFTP